MNFERLDNARTQRADTGRRKYVKGNSFLPRTFSIIFFEIEKKNFVRFNFSHKSILLQYGSINKNKETWKAKLSNLPISFRRVSRQGYCIFDEPFDKKYCISKKGKTNRKAVEV